MTTTIENAIRNDFQAFVEKAFLELQGGSCEQPYVGYLCCRLENLKPGTYTVNLPPRHLRTFIGSICLAAWTLGRNPRARIMVVAGREELAEEIARPVRDIIRSEWFSKAFPKTRLSKSKVTNFTTTARGALYATSIFGNFTGRGADLIIVDDPLNIADAADLDKIDRVNDIFDNVVVSQLNNQATGVILIIMHRLHDQDLCGHVHGQGPCNRIALPLIARRAATYVGYEDWIRKKGELLRPDAFTKRAIKKLENIKGSPGFQLLYQQNPLGESFRRVKRCHFGSVTEVPDVPVVLSVDPSLVGGHDSSFNVIQVWARDGEHYLLIDQWRERCSFSRLRRRCLRMIGKYRPAAVLVERTGNGAALISELLDRRKRVEEIVPLESKLERFRQVSGIIRSGKVKLREGARWHVELLDEITNFPTAPNDDQTDALTQALAWLQKATDLEKPPARAVAVGINSRGEPIVINPQATSVSSRGDVIVLSRSVTGFAAERTRPNSGSSLPKSG